MATFQLRTSNGGPGAKIVRTLFFLVFTGIGLAVTGVFATTMLKGMASWRWEPAQCQVLSSRVEDLLFSLPLEEAAKEDRPYRLGVAYQWEREGRTFHGEGVGGRAQFGSRQRAAEVASRYPVGGVVGCYVDPRDPTQAALRRPKPWTLLILCFPLLFVAFGIGGLISTWRGPWRAGWRRDRPGGVGAPRSQRVGGGRGCMVGFFSIFALFGAGFLIPFAIPLARKASSSDWEKVPATIVWSGVGAHSSDDGATYSVDVLYEYGFGRERYRANRYRFFGGSSSGTTGKQEVVARLPPGARVDAWVDPDDPSSAVLERKVGPFVWFAALPLVFVLVGVGGMALTLRAGRRRAAGLEWLPSPSAEAEGGAAGAGLVVGGATVRESAAGPAAMTQGGAGLPAVPRGPVTLKPAKSRLGGFIAMLLFTLVWDGIVGVALWAVYRDGKLFHDGCITVFLGVFALVGVLLLIALPGQFLALFNPRAELVLSAPIAPGAPAALAWRFEGATSRISRLTMQIEGREEATYRRGTDSVTDKRTFARLSLLDTTDPNQMVAGETAVLLPADTMHSFKSSHNKIVWTLKLHGEIARWPDIADEVTLTVYPAGLVS